MKKGMIRNLILASLCLALCFLLPFLTGQIPQIGSMLSPMHIPVFLCGFLCGAPWGLFVGAAAPLLRSLLFGMPPMVPVALAMMVELAVYGFVAGLLYRLLPDKPIYTYVALIGAMLAGRVAWGLASFAIYALFLPTGFTFEMFLAGAFVKAVPGIIAHILIIPPLVLALNRAGLVQRQTARA